MLFTSEVTGKTYKTVEELEAAEKKVAAEKAKAEAEKEAKKAELDALNEAASAYLALVAEDNKARAEMKVFEEEAYKRYQAELDKFAEKHNGYHLTYKVDGTNVEFEIQEARKANIDEYIAESKKAFDKFFNSFFWF